MTIRIKIAGGSRYEQDQRAQALIYAIGSTKYGGSAIHIANNTYEFDVPQAFTRHHPAIIYLLEHA